MSGGRRQLETGKPPETKVLRSLRRRRFLVPSLLAAVILVAVLFLAFSIKTTLDVNPPGEVIIDKTVTVDPYNLTMHNLWCPNDTNKFCLLSWSRHGCSFFYTVINRNASFGNNVLNESERIQVEISVLSGSSLNLHVSRHYYRSIWYTVLDRTNFSYLNEVVALSWASEYAFDMSLANQTVTTIHIKLIKIDPVNC